MKKIVLVILYAVFFMTTMTATHADEQCDEYPQKIYDDLLKRAKNNDKDAMFELSITYCDDCKNSTDTCAHDAMKWLKAAADHGHKKAKDQLYIVSEDPPTVDKHGNALHLNQEIKNGDYIFRSYRDTTRGTAYFEILKNNKVLFIPKKHADIAGYNILEYRGILSTHSLIGDSHPTLEVWPNNMGHAGGVSWYYFSLGKELKCLVNKKSNSMFWPLNRFEEDHSPTAKVALKNGTGELKSCSLVADNLFAK